MKNEWKPIGDVPRYKYCPNCGMTYDLNEVSECPVCSGKAKKKIWYDQRNPEKLKEYFKKYNEKRKKNKTKISCLYLVRKRYSKR
jgi:transposase